MPAPKSTGAHKTFDLEEEEFGEDAGTVASTESEEEVDAAPSQSAASEDEPESDSGSEVEEITTQSARKAARANASAEQKRRERYVAEEEADEDEGDEEEAAVPASSDERVTTRLDPALFAAAFAHRDAQARAALQHPAPSQAPAPKKRYARGRDGQPMVRVAHEATLVRALAPEREVDVVDAALEHEPLDPSRALPSARERAYRKRKLGLRANDVRASAIDAVKRAPPTQKKPHAKDPDDPLGLNDPAFQEGGEFAHLARPKRKRTHARTPTPAATAVRGAGGRVAAPHAARLGPALQFARGR